MKTNYFFLFLMIVCLFSCAKNEINQSKINEKSLDMQVLEAYNEGLKNLEDGDVIYAAKKFNEVEMLFPQSEWAPKSALMAAYSYYIQDYYVEAIAELERFIKLYPNDKHLDYAYYLLAISYNEQIVDETKDTNSIIQAKKYFNFVLNNFPNTDYAIDSQFKLDLIEDILASKEMYIARYYFEKKKWISAINRYKTVINDYDTTVYTEEALHRLVEIYYILGLKDESIKYAKLLGYNYKSSEWYRKSYKIFNENYERNEKSKKIKKKQNTILMRFKSLLE